MKNRTTTEGQPSTTEHNREQQRTSKTTETTKTSRTSRTNRQQQAQKNNRPRLKKVESKKAKASADVCSRAVPAEGEGKQNAQLMQASTPPHPSLTAQPGPTCDPTGRTQPRAHRGHHQSQPNCRSILDGVTLVQTFLPFYPAQDAFQLCLFF